MGLIERGRLVDKSLYAIGKRLGISNASLYYYAKNPGRIPLEIAEKLRVALNFSPSEWSAWFQNQIKK